VFASLPAACNGGSTERPLEALKAVPVNNDMRSRRQLLRHCLLGVVASTLVGAQPSMAAAQTLLRLARIENVPDQAVGGEILTVVYAKLGITLELVAVPAKRSLIESSEGRLDGETQRVLDVEREYPTLVPVREPVNYIEPSAFTKRLDFRVEGWESIRPYMVGIVRGVGSSERGTRGMPRVEAAPGMEQLMEMLANDRVEVAVNDLFSGLLVNARLGLDHRLHPLSPPLQHIDLYHFLHVRHRELVPKVEAVVRQMRASGELERLRREITARMFDDARKK